MKKKRAKPRRSPKPKKPPPRGRSARVAAPLLSAPRSLQYKVVELSNVDEGSIERAVNDGVALGWTLEHVQFAMRESSKRPAMAFVFFVREGDPVPVRSEAEASSHLRRLAEGAPDFEESPAPRVISPLERLRQLAGDGDDS